MTNVYVTGYRVLRRTKDAKGRDTFAKIGRVFHVRASAEQLARMMNDNASKLGEERDYYVQDIVGADNDEPAPR